jgi:rhamnogalacturonyl hydrolase YesR
MHACRLLELFRTMSRAVLRTQIPDGDPAGGFWGPSLLAHDLYPFPEASGTSFFVTGLAWGVRTGVLEGREYLAAARRGWNALQSAQLPHGAIGWVQQIGGEPDAVQRHKTQLYASGGFLSAAAEMLRLEACAKFGRVSEHAPAASPPGAPLCVRSSVGVALWASLCGLRSVGVALWA